MSHRTDASLGIAECGLLDLHVSLSQLSPSLSCHWQYLGHVRGQEGRRTVVVDAHAVVECLLSQLFLRILHHRFCKICVWQADAVHLDRLWGLDILLAIEDDRGVAGESCPTIGLDGIGGHCMRF